MDSKLIAEGVIRIHPMAGVFDKQTEGSTVKEISLQAPLLLKRKAVIARTFDVDPDTVVAWAREGAPIFLAGKKYQADYQNMVDWLVQNRPVFENLSTPKIPPV